MTNTVAVCDWDSNPEEIAQSVKDTGLFDQVVLCVEERHIVYREDNVHEMIQHLHDRDVKVRLNPWGIVGFAGESISTPYAYEEWLRFAEESTCDSIMLDEPSLGNWEGKRVLASILAPSKHVHLATEPVHFKAHTLSPGKSDAITADSVSISAYIFENGMNVATPELIEDQVELWYQHSVQYTRSAWVQAWGIPCGREWVPAKLIAEWKKRDVDINIWAWDAFRTVSSKRPANPDLVWQTIKDALKDG